MQFTYSSFEDIVVDVVGTTLRAGESEPLTVFVALFVIQLDRSSQRTLGLLLPLVLLLSPELTGIQACDRQIASTLRIQNGYTFVVQDRRPIMSHTTFMYYSS